MPRNTTHIVYSMGRPRSQGERTRNQTFTISRDTEAFLKPHFTARVDNTTRRQWHKKHGAPRLSATACPKLDKIMKQNLSSQTKTKDRQLSKTQALVLDAVGPLAYILEAAGQDNFTMADAVDAVQTALKLLGNASCHLAMERRRNVLTDLNPNLKDMAEEDKLFRDVAPNLFGEGFSKKAKERDKELKVLKSTKQVPKKTANWRNRDNHFFSRMLLLCTGHQGRRNVQRPQQTICQTKALPTKRKGHRPTSTTTKTKEAKNFRTNSTVCIPISTTCNKYTRSRLLFAKHLPVNNCKTITGDGTKGHSYYSSSETTTICRAYSALQVQLGGDNWRCMGAECHQRVRIRPGIDTLPVPPTKRANSWERGVDDPRYRDRQDGEKKGQSA